MGQKEEKNKEGKRKKKGRKKDNISF